MSLLFESLRIDQGHVHHLEYHLRRVIRTLGADTIDLAHYIHSIPIPTQGCHKLRITYTPHQITSHSIEPYTPRTIQTLQLVQADHIDYTCKWNDRTQIDRLTTLRGTADDILIVRNGQITDSSFANIALFDGTHWITPDKPLLAGTCRERLIDQGILIPRPIPLETLNHYPHLILINALIGFDPLQAISNASIHR